MAANALTTRTDMLPAEREWATMLAMAETLFRSGMLPAHIKNAAATVAIVQKGRELGIPPMHALTNIAVIQGKPTANSELMLALIYRDHGDEAVRFIVSTDQACEVKYRRRGWSAPLSFMFTMDEAKRAGLLGNQTWQKYPAAMLRARCISAVARMAFPDSIGGMYTPEELGADVDADGQVIATPTPLRAIAEVAPTPEPAPATALATVPQQRLLWKLTQEYYGKEDAHEKLHAWIAGSFPHAMRDGKPSLRALSHDETAQCIRELEQAIRDREAATPADEPIDGEIVPDQQAIIAQ